MPWALAALITIGMAGTAGPAAAATTYYVATSGNDGGTGTQAQPWRTLQHAADVASAGDTVVVEPGTYVGAKFARSGTSASPITFSAQQGVVVNAAGSQNSNGDDLWVRDADYVTLQGFEVT